MHPENTEIASYFWTDFLSRHGGECRTFKQIDILAEFVEWMFKRASSGNLPDLRVIRSETAQTVIDTITEEITHKCQRPK